MNRERAAILSISLLSVIAGIVLFRYTLYQPDYSSASQSNEVLTTQVSPLSYDQIILNDLTGRPQALTEWDKPVKVINFWAPWCAPCRREMPALIELQQTYADQVQFIGLSFDSRNNVLEFKKTMPINYPLLIVQSESSTLNRFFGNQSSGLPFTAILNAKHEIIYRHTGEIRKQQLEAQLQLLL